MFNPDLTNVILNIGSEVECLPSLIKQQVYRITQELFSNCVKHANASEVLVKIGIFDQDELVLGYYDNGKGFNLTCARKGIGLINISLRTKALDGNLDIDTAPKKGTRVKIRIPIHRKGKLTM
jgi:two-component system sensor histidine kinase DegS